MPDNALASSTAAWSCALQLLDGLQLCTISALQSASHFPSVPWFFSLPLRRAPVLRSTPSALLLFKLLHAASCFRCHH